MNYHIQCKLVIVQKKLAEHHSRPADGLSFPVDDDEGYISLAVYSHPLIALTHIQVSTIALCSSYISTTPRRYVPHTLIITCLLPLDLHLNPRAFLVNAY